MAIDNIRALSKLRRERKKVGTIILAVQIGNENFQSKKWTSKEKIQEKTKWLQMIFTYKILYL